MTCLTSSTAGEPLVPSRRDDADCGGARAGTGRRLLTVATQVRFLSPQLEFDCALGRAAKAPAFQAGKAGSIPAGHFNSRRRADSLPPVGPSTCHDRGSANGRPPAFEAGDGGSNPPPRTQHPFEFQETFDFAWPAAPPRGRPGHSSRPTRSPCVSTGSWPAGSPMPGSRSAWWTPRGRRCTAKRSSRCGQPVDTRELDAFLADKDAVAQKLEQFVRRHVSTFGVEVLEKVAHAVAAGGNVCGTSAESASRQRRVVPASDDCRTQPSPIRPDCRRHRES